MASLKTFKSETFKIGSACWALDSEFQFHANFGKDKKLVDFAGGTVVKNLPANARDTGSSPGSGRSHMLQSN